MANTEEILYKIGTAKKQPIEFIAGGKIDEEVLDMILGEIREDARKSNKGNTTAGRRFRLNTTALEKSFIGMRKVSPKSKTKKNK
jgi:hypothetical protein